MARIARLWAPLLAFQALLFYLSSRPGVPLGFSNGDKAIHFTAYALLAALWARALAPGFDSLGTAKALAAFVLTVLFGWSDEFHQSFVPGRDASVADLLADALGAACALAILRWRKSRAGARRRSGPEPGALNKGARRVI